MAIKKKVMQKNLSIPSVVLLAMLCSALVTLLGCIILTSLIEKESVEMLAIPYGVIIILTGASLTAGVFINQRTDDKRLISALCYAFCWLAVLFGINALFFEGSYSRIPSTVIAVLAGSVGPVLIKNASSGQKTKFHKMRRM